MGKTTLIRSIIGFTPPRTGQVVFKGRDITGWPSTCSVALGMGLKCPRAGGCSRRSP